ncbi:MAG: DUF5655 domain-containing protein [Candidatus Acidiferrales bacterium]
MSARKKGLNKTKTSKKSKSPAKNSPPPKSRSGPSNAKGSVTLHLEAQHGRAFTEAELVDGLNEDLRDAWEKLRAFAAGLGPQRIYASALSIMFARKVCYIFVRPKKTFLEVWIFLPREIEGLTSMHGPTKKARYCNLFKLVHADQIEEPLTDWIREAFDFAPGLG